MNCYVCDRAGRPEPAGATCGTCSVGLCREHLDEELLTIGPGGMRYGCSHDPAAWARATATTDNPTPRSAQP
jgi:hypothetical protein